MPTAEGSKGFQRMWQLLWTAGCGQLKLMMMIASEGGVTCCRMRFFTSFITYLFRFHVSSFLDRCPLSSPFFKTHICEERKSTARNSTHHAEQVDKRTVSLWNI